MFHAVFMCSCPGNLIRWRFTEQALYTGYLCTHHDTKKSTDSKYGWELPNDCEMDI